MHINVIKSYCIRGAIGYNREDKIEIFVNVSRKLSLRDVLEFPFTMQAILCPEGRNKSKFAAMTPSKVPGYKSYLGTGKHSV